MPLTKAYGLASNPTPRREAPPLPLSFVVFLEKSIINSVGSGADRLAMGGFLLMIWGSLRWSDVHWVFPTELTDDATTLRGWARRTKSATRGMPFGVLRSSFLGHTSPTSWASVWMTLMREAIHRTSVVTMASFPTLSPRRWAQMWITRCDPLCLSPLPRSQGILLLRRFLFGLMHLLMLAT